MNAELVLLLAVFFDFLIGDPGGKYHPVALIGRLISAVENFFYRETSSKTSLFFRGMLTSLIVMFIIGSIIVIVTKYTNNQVGAVFQALLLSFAISTKTLAQRGIEIANELKLNNLEGARKMLSYIVSRDTTSLCQEDIVRGTVETMAENFIDGIVAPLFWFAVFGLPGAFIYRAANTLDAMIGYRNHRYEYFGKFTARTDDVLNYIPARIGGVILLLSGIVLKYSLTDAIRNWLKDSGSHPSPNAGIPEAVIAGFLGVRLGGYNYYHGKQHFRAYLGTVKENFNSKHIFQLRTILYLGTIIYSVILSISIRMTKIPWVF